MQIYTFGFCLMALTLIIPATSTADERPLVTFDGIIQQALNNQPAIQAYQSAIAAAQEQVQLTKQLPDPQLKFGIINIPITGNDSLRLNRDNMTMTSIGLMQQMVRPAKRMAASAQWQAKAMMMAANAQHMAQLIRRDAALAWLDMFAAEKTMLIRQKLIDELQSERQVDAAQVSSGNVTASELLQLDSLIAMTQDQYLVSEREAHKARSVLARWIANIDNQPLSMELPELKPPSIESFNIHQHPLMLIAEQNIVVNRHQAALALAEEQPNWSWEFMIGQRQSSRADMFSLQISMDLPWQPQNRQHLLQASSLANVEQAEFLVEEQRRALRADFSHAQAEYNSAKQRELEYLKQIIPTTNAALITSQASYQAGKTPLSTVWLARRAVLEVELAYCLIKVERLRAIVRLDYFLQDQHNANKGVLP